MKNVTDAFISKSSSGPGPACRMIMYCGGGACGGRGSCVVGELGGASCELVTSWSSPPPDADVTSSLFTTCCDVIAVLLLVLLRSSVDKAVAAADDTSLV